MFKILSNEFEITALSYFGSRNWNKKKMRKWSRRTYVSTQLTMIYMNIWN